jgi:hypothetical protein
MEGLAEGSVPYNQLLNDLPRDRRPVWPFFKGVHAAMVKGVFDELLKAEPKNHFTVGINDDVTHSSIEYDPSFSIEALIPYAAFRGLGRRHRGRQP